MPQIVTRFEKLVEEEVHVSSRPAGSLCEELESTPVP